MVHTCVVSGCRNRRTPGTALSFYRFPRDPERKQRWILGQNDHACRPAKVLNSNINSNPMQVKN
uniref:THAP-type domain-containing protein n=1 Tax=Astyanax mexicanus TaxID=7994 RepID=A0A8B9H3V4_ASTMX